MTAHRCPECHLLGFTWADEDAKTEWYCSRCQYLASETGSRLECEDCGEPGALQLADEEHEYHYCLACGFKAASN
jgi:hypothetical protein